MNPIKTQVLSAFLLALISSAALADRLNFTPAEFHERYGKQKVIYHVDSGDVKKQTGVLRSITNHIKGVGKDNIQINVVLHGGGLQMLLLPNKVSGTKFKVGNANADFQTIIYGLREQGVRFVVCNNALHETNIDYSKDLFNVKKSDIVPAAVAELARLQHMGYAYIKI